MTPGEPRPRPRDVGIDIGLLAPGPLNSITDVPGVRVGHVTFADNCTGVTVIVPGALRDVFERGMAAGTAVLNGTGELTGSISIGETGVIETPIALTATLSVGLAFQGIVEAMMSEIPEIAAGTVMGPVVGECDDSWLSDPSRMSVQPRHVGEALSLATDGLVEGGAVGGGAGMMCLGWKGGIGTASRQVVDHVLGVLVMTNYGSIERLCINGSPVGRRFAELGRCGEREGSEGSCIAIVATDAPMLPVQCQRIARRCGLGLARTGSIATHGSGEIFAAFSTTCRLPRDQRGGAQHDVVTDRDLDPFFAATVEATEEAVIDSLFRATTTHGRFGRVGEALPIDEMLALM